MVFIKYTSGKIKNIEGYMECSCSSTEHLIRFSFDKEYNFLYLNIHLANCNSWYKRVWVAIKYIFGYKSKYGAFDEFIFKNENVKDLLYLLAQQKKIKK